MSIRPNMITQLGPILHWWCWACPTLICKTTLQWRINSQYRTCYLGNTTVEERYDSNILVTQVTSCTIATYVWPPRSTDMLYSLHLFLLLWPYQIWVGIIPNMGGDRCDMDKDCVTGPNLSCCHTISIPQTLKVILPPLHVFTRPTNEI